MIEGKLGNLDRLFLAIFSSLISPVSIKKVCINNLFIFFKNISLGKLHMSRKKFSWFLQFTIITSALLVQGCGGGGGGSKQSNASTTSSVSLSSSLSSTNSSTSSSSALSNKLTITGLVVADALAGADVEFIVGSQVFKTKANDKKQYSIDLAVLSENLFTPISAKATGVNNNSWIQFAGSLPSLNQLKALAGEDAILNVNEFFGVNISSLTTAQFVLANESKRKINTDEDRKWAMLEVSFDRQTEMAATLNILLTDVRLNLPKNTTNTLDFLLDKNTSLAYINILKSRDSSYFNDSIESIEADINQTKKPNKALDGRYLVYSANVIYHIELNNDGTGRFQSGPRLSAQLQTFSSTNSVNFIDLPITWIKKDTSIKIDFSSTVVYGEVSGYSDPQNANAHVSCDNDGTPCNLTLSSIFLTHVTDNEVNTSVKLTIEAVLKDGYGSVVYDYAKETQYVNMRKIAGFPEITSKDILGYEWYLDTFKYIFNSDGTASQTNLATKQERSIDWKIEDGHLLLDNGSLTIWLNYPTESGFLITKWALDIKQYGALLQMPMVKRQSVKMTNQDWIGRWTASQIGVDSSFYDVYSNGKWRDGFQPSSRGNWSVLDDTKQVAISDGTWRMYRDVLAVYDGRYYIELCQGYDSENFNPYCSLEVVTKDESHGGNTLWASWTEPLFQDLLTDTVWSFRGTQSLSYNRETNKNFIKVSADRLYDPANAKVLQVMSSTAQTVDVCEYDIFSSCDLAKQITLTRGLEISILSPGSDGTIGGRVDYIQDGFGTAIFAVGAHIYPRNKSLWFQVISHDRYSLESIDGCGGVLNAKNYDVPPLNSDCDITVTFVKSNN